MLIYSCCSDSTITEAGRGHELLPLQLDAAVMMATMLGWLVSMCKVNNTAGAVIDLSVFN